MASKTTSALAKSKETLAIAATFSLAVAMAFGCKPDLGDPVSLVKETRILAVKSEPPEAAPGATVHLTALVASPTHTAPPSGPAALAVTWSDCTTPKPPSENNFVSAGSVAPPDQPGEGGRPAEEARFRAGVARRPLLAATTPAIVG